MMPSAPLIGRMLLRVIVPRADHEYIAGDLLEEFRLHMVPALGDSGARRWYLRQALRSACPFLLLRLRRGTIACDLLCAQLAVAAPLASLHLLWMFVLSQVPLRAANITHGYAVASMVCLVLIVAGSGFAHAIAVGGIYRRSIVAFPAAILLMAAMMISLVDAHWIAWPKAMLAALPLAAFAGGATARGLNQRSDVRRPT